MHFTWELKQILYPEFRVYITLENLKYYLNVLEKCILQLQQLFVDLLILTLLNISE